MISAQIKIFNFITATLLILMTALPVSADTSGSVKPAYMISSGNVVVPEKMPAYLKASAPLFEAAGSEEIAFGKVDDNGIHLLEGKWPYPGLVMIIKFPSMAVLKKFWDSPEYQKAMKLREGVVEPNFTIAIEKTR